MKTRPELRSNMLRLLTWWALAINYCNRTTKACKYFGQPLGLYAVLFFVLRKAVDEDLRLNHIFLKRELLNWLIFHTVCVCEYVCREREGKNLQDQLK